MQPQIQNLESAKRGLYRRKSDDAIFFLIGTRPFITPQETADILKRPVCEIRKRLCQFEAKEYGYMAKLDGGSFQPKYWYVTTKGEAYSGQPDLVSWDDKSPFTLPHERGITEFALALYSGFGEAVHDPYRRRDAGLKETVGQHSFYPDWRFILHGCTFYLEYTNANPRSEDGVSDLDTKIDLYNRLLKNDKNAKVIFVFNHQAEHRSGVMDVEKFLNRMGEKFPYLWCYATDLPSFKKDPTGKVFWSPHDFDERRHSLIE